MSHWTKSTFTIDDGELGKIIFTAFNPDNPEQRIIFELPSEVATQIAEALLIKVAYVEYQISEAVERMTKLD